MRIRDFFDDYARLLYRTRHISMTAAFVISLVMSIELVTFVYRLAVYESAEMLRENLGSAVLIVGFHILLAAVFAVRFANLRIETGWQTTQLVWIAGWLSILLYKLVTAKFLFGSFFGQRTVPAMDAMYYDTFLGASVGQFFLLMGYLVFSPVKQLFWLTFLFRGRAQRDCRTETAK